MEERNAQIEKEDEEKKAEELKERKRKVLGMLSKIISFKSPCNSKIFKIAKTSHVIHRSTPKTP